MKLVDLKKKYEGKYLTYYVASYLNNDNKIKEYEFVSRNKNLTIEEFGNIKANGVAILAFDDLGRILLEKEYRLACNKWIYSFPAGLIDEGETIDMAAKRELFEETGLELYDIKGTLPPVHSSIGISDDSLTTVIGKARGEIKDSCFVDEEIKASWYTKEECKKLLDGSNLSARCQMFLYMWIGGLL